MTLPRLRSVLALLAATLFLSAHSVSDARRLQAQEEEAMLVQYLEVVTPDVDETCSVLEKMHGVSFGMPDAGLGNARTAALEGGGKIGVRAPMRSDESPVVRPYTLVEDIEAAINEAQAAGSEIAMAPMEIPGHGKFAIYILGGIEHGLWEL